MTDRAVIIRFLILTDNNVNKRSWIWLDSTRVSFVRGGPRQTSCTTVPSPLPTGETLTAACLTYHCTIPFYTAAMDDAIVDAPKLATERTNEQSS